jgi:hypothetical protein
VVKKKLNGGIILNTEAHSVLFKNCGTLLKLL